MRVKQDLVWFCRVIVIVIVIVIAIVTVTVTVFVTVIVMALFSVKLMQGFHPESRTNLEKSGEIWKVVVSPRDK